MNETYEEAKIIGCSICSSTINLIPKAGSGVVIHWVCYDCVKSRNLEVEQEYINKFEGLQEID